MIAAPIWLESSAPNHILFEDVREEVISTRRMVARGVNVALVLLYRKVGERIRRDFLKEKLAGNGEEIVSTLSAQLAAAFAGLFTLPIPSWAFFRVSTNVHLRLVATTSRRLGIPSCSELLASNSGVALGTLP